MEAMKIYAIAMLYNATKKLWRLWICTTQQDDQRRF